MFSFLFPFILWEQNASKFFSKAKYALNPVRLNIDRGALGSKCHARSGLGIYWFSDTTAVIALASIFHCQKGAKTTQQIEHMGYC